MSKHIVVEEPPVKQDQRRSRWVEVFEEARAHKGEWCRISEPLKRSTAAQIASDIRNAHLRDPEKSRLRGFKPGEMWEARWGTHPDKDPDPEHYYIWLKYLGDAPAAGKD
jgi:hypothetical protein